MKLRSAFAFDVRFPRTWADWRAALFSLDDHPSRVISDRALRRRYTRSRLTIAVLGAVIGAVGFGVAYSHSGGIDFAAERSIVAPAIVGAVLAIVFILVPTPPLLRWFGLAAVFGWSIAVLDVSGVWKIGLGLVGWVVSLLVAYLLLLVVVSGRNIWRQIGIGISGGACLLIVIAPYPALPAVAAAETGPPICEATSLALDGRGVAVGPGAEPFALTVEGSPTVFLAEASTSYTSGTLVVRLVNTAPIPLLAGEDPVVWAGLIEADGERGTVGPIELVLTDSGLMGTYVASFDAHEADLNLVAGRGTYVLTFSDQITGESCETTVVLDLLATPTSSLAGLAGLTIFALGTAAATGAAVGGVTRVSQRLDVSHLNAPVVAVSVASALARRVVDIRDPYDDARSDARKWTVQLALEVREEDHDVREITHASAGFCALIGVGAKIDLGSGFEIPIHVEIEPDRLRDSIPIVQLDIGPGLGQFEFTLERGADNRWRATQPSWDPAKVSA